MTEQNQVAKKEERKTVERTPSNSALASMASRLKVRPDVLQKTLKATAFKECRTDEQFVAALIVADNYKLNPLLQEMTAFPSQKGVTPVVMIDGWVTLARRQKDYRGVRFKDNFLPNGEKNNSGTNVDSITAIFKIAGEDGTYEVEATEYMDECYKGDRDPWKKWPRRMLRHKAYIQAARMAWGFGGIYDPDEAERIKQSEKAESESNIPEIKEPQAINDPVIDTKEEIVINNDNEEIVEAEVVVDEDPIQEEEKEIDLYQDLLKQVENIKSEEQLRKEMRGIAEKMTQLSGQDAMSISKKISNLEESFQK